MRRNRGLRVSVTSSSASKTKLVNNYSSSQSSAQGLFSSLNKLYIRNFHEYHSRSRGADNKKTSSKALFDESTARRIQFELESKQTIDSIANKRSDNEHQRVQITKENEKNQINPESSKTIAATVAASALMRRNRYSTKAFFSKNVLNENKLKKSKDKRKELHFNRMIAAYKLEWLQDNLEQLKDHFELLSHKNRIVTRECSLLSRDLEKIKSDYTCVLDNVIKKDCLLKEEGKLRFFNDIPKSSSLFENNFQWKINRNQKANLNLDLNNNVEKQTKEKEDLKVDLNNNQPDEQNLNDTQDVIEKQLKINELSLNDSLCLSNDCGNAFELLRNSLTENGQVYLNEKIKQLLADNDRLIDYRFKLNTLVQDNKCRTKSNASNANCNGLVNKKTMFSTKPNGSTNGKLHFEPEVAESDTIGKHLIRKNRHTINLPNRLDQSQINKQFGSLHLKQLKKGTLNDSLDNLDKLRQEIRSDEEDLRNQHLKQNEKLLKEELIAIESDLKSKQFHEQLLSKDIESVQSKLKVKLLRLEELKKENESLKKRMLQLEQIT